MLGKWFWYYVRYGGIGGYCVILNMLVSSIVLLGGSFYGYLL